MRCRTIAAALTSIALIVCGAWLSGCTPPGPGEKAAAGYSDAQPVIVALKTYHDKHNEYPVALAELVPDDLAESASTTSDGKPIAEFFGYEKSGASYRLKFSYTGPGMNRCVYTPEAGKWECSGYH